MPVTSVSMGRGWPCSTRGRHSNAFPPWPLLFLSLSLSLSGRCTDIFMGQSLLVGDRLCPPAGVAGGAGQDLVGTGPPPVCSPHAHSHSKVLPRLCPG